MTVSSQTNNATFVGNGVTTVFPLPFRFFANSDVFAYFIDSTTGAATPIVQGVDYTLFGEGMPEVDGNAVSVLTTTAPLANGRGLYVERIMQEVQSTDIVNQGEFFASTHEDVFDRLTMLIQQANANSQGAIRVAIGDPDPQRLPPASQRAGRLLSFDSQGQPVVVAPSSGSATELAIMLANDADHSEGAAMIGGLIASSLTINVPADHATIAEAMTWLRDRTIARNAVITVKVSDGTYTLTSGISLNHPQGGQIQLIGNTVAPENCELTVLASATFDAIACSGGNQFGLLDGFTITRPSKAEMPLNTTGIIAVQNSTIICGNSIVVRNWFYGIAARDASYIYCPNAQVDLAGDVGIWAFCGSTIVCNGAKSTNANAAGNPWGYGFQAEFGSVLVGTGIEASGCKIGGIASLSNSTCRVEASYTHDNIGSGYFVRDTAIIEAGDGITTNNTRYGLEVLSGQGQITGVASNVGNALGSANAFPFTNVAAGQGQLTTSAGPLRIDTSDASSIFLNTAGGLQAEIAHVAAASSRVKLSGSSIGYPNIAAEGSGADISLEQVSKGAGSVISRTGGGRQLEVYNTPSAVNFLVATGAPTGGTPIVGVAGTSTNIDLRLSTKGTGRVWVGPHTGSADAAIVGYIEVRDSTGVTRKLAVIA